jgi:pyruvate kinase
MLPPVPAADLAAAANLIRELERMRSEILRLERLQPLYSFGARRSSPRNLVDYLAFRRFDARGLQEGLARLGLSSLGHAESHVRGNLDSVLRQLYLLTGQPIPVHPSPSSLGPESGRKLIDRHARALFGPPRPGRRTRIMVTVPSEFATDASRVQDSQTGEPGEGSGARARD